MELANTVLTPVADGLAKVAEGFGSLPQPMQDFAVVLGALLLAGLYALFGDVVMPTLNQRIKDMFNYAGALGG